MSARAVAGIGPVDNGHSMSGAPGSEGAAVVGAVYFDPGAVNVAGQLGAEIDDHAGDFFRAAHSRGRDAGVVLHPAAALLGRGQASLTVPVGDRVLGLDPAGGDGIDRDAVLRVLVGNRL